MQVEMTTGATIHTTQGLKMTVTRRIRPPIMPVLKTHDDKIILDQKTTEEASPAHS